MNVQQNRPSVPNRRPPVKKAAPAAPRAAARPASSASAARPSRPAQKPAPKKSAPSPQKSASFIKKAGKIALEILKVLGLMLAVAFGYVSSFIKWVNKKLNVFRKSEATSVITNCAVGAVLLSVLLIIFLLLKPSMDASRARSLAEKGRAVEAIRIVERLGRTGYNEEKLFKTSLSVAESLINAEKFDGAREILSALQKNEKTDALQTLLNYRYAQFQYRSGQYSAAAQLFYQMPEYLDSLEGYYNCRCALAVQAFLNGQEHQVQSLLMEIPNVSDRVKSVLSDMTVGQDDEIASQLSEAFSEEKLRDFEQMVTILTAARENMQKGRVAAGYCHTLGLTKSGTVLAAGDNMYGQCNVQSWTNVAQVAAGAYHSVALFKDGTVAAVGDNTQNQLDVSSWTDIVAIAASAYDTIGLKSDGSVVACGMHADLVSRWHGVTLISGGAHAMGCLYDKGYMMATHPGAQMDASIALFDLSVSGGASAGVLYDGSLITTFENAPAWTDLVSVELSPAGLFAINANGAVLTHFFRPADAFETNFPIEAAEIASGGAHHVILFKDGSVQAFGDNEFGQLNTASWNLENQ
ncbi:MAG: hypothetical protein E7322_12490 [Clostridiales bacterium]|nr:hypothetical protein [Clostridiales bacterium]